MGATADVGAVPEPAQAACSRTHPEAWSRDLDQFIFKGNVLIEEVWFLHRKSRTVIAADFIQNHPIERGHFIRNALWRAD